MSDRLSISVDLAHDLELAFRRADWDAEEVKELTKGDMLRLVREVVLGRAEICPRQIPEPPKPPLLEFVGAVKVAATAEPFVAREKFVKDTGRKATVKISYMWDNFTTWLLGKIEEPTKEATLRYATLLRPSVDCERCYRRASRGERGLDRRGLERER